MVFEENILRFTVTVRFQELEFSYHFSVSYNNVVVTKQIYFSPTFLKSWVHIYGNITGIDGGPQYY